MGISRVTGSDAGLSPRDQVSESIQTQFLNPGDILSVLMVIGGSIVWQALGQLSGGPLVPVAFSFGWVAYSFEALLSAVGDNRLMPLPDCACIVINAETGFHRQNRSWVLGRILRDFEKPIENALCVTVFRAKEGPGEAGRDWVWDMGLGTMLLQFGIASIPLALYRNWSVLLVTGCGTLLALVGGALPQWKAEKWACRPKSKKKICLTRGNGYQHVMLILGEGVGFDLEDLAGGRQIPFAHTRPMAALLAFFWVVFLITVAGLKAHTWYMLVVGCVGMVQNVVGAGAARTPAAFGIPLEEIEKITHKKVMKVLMATEEAYPSVGASLLPVFFPGDLRQDETKWWNDRKAIANQKTEPEGQAPTDTLVALP